MDDDIKYSQGYICKHYDGLKAEAKEAEFSLVAEASGFRFGGVLYSQLSHVEWVMRGHKLAMEKVKARDRAADPLIHDGLKTGREPNTDIKEEDGWKGI